MTMTDIKLINLKSPPSNLKATVNFHLVFPQELQIKLKNKIFDTSPKERAAEWKKINLDIDKVSNSFKEMLKERNNFAYDKGFSSRLVMALDWFGIPRKDFENFVKNVDGIISLCSRQLLDFKHLPGWFYTEFHSPCFICQITKFPLKSLDQTFDFVAKSQIVINKFKKKININLGHNSKMLYKKESDTFEITIDENVNTRHQITDLIHELSHMVSYLESFKKGIDMSGKGVYLREKQALKIETEILRSLSIDLYKAVLFGETLALIFRTLFEIEIYKNPNQNLEKLYANNFNKCYKVANQKTNLLYLLDERIIFYPFTSLPYVIAHTTLLHQKRSVTNIS